MFKISSAEQSRKEHNLEKVDSEGWALPEQYCEITGLDTPNAFAISLFDFPDNSISNLIFSLICKSKLFFMIKIFY